MEKVIHITVPKDISAAQLEVIDCARATQLTWEVKVWQDPVQSDGFLLEKYWSKANSGAQFADLLRLDVLYRFGGVYVDSDLRLLKPLDELVQNFKCFIASEDGYHLTNALIGAPKGCSAIRGLIDELIHNEPDWSLAPNITTGPKFFSRHLKSLKEISVLPRETFYPYVGNSAKPKVHRHSYGEHLWAASWVPGEASGAPASNETRFQRWCSDAFGRVKPYVKREVIRGFRIWRRLRSIDPLPPSKFYQSADELIVKTIHGFNIVVDGRDVSITPELVFKGYYELPTENCLKNVVKGGDWVIDVGANIGSFSLLAAQCVGPFGRVFSFEPNPRPAELMAKSLAMNWVQERVLQRPVAVGDSSGMATLTFAPECLGGAQVNTNEENHSIDPESSGTIGMQRSVVLQVPCVRLDDEFPVDLPIKMLKIDVEGFEGQVLAGARRLLQHRCIDFVMLELLEEIAGSRWQEIVDEVKKVINFGYEVCSLTAEGALVEQRDLNAAIGAGYRNIVLVAQERYMTSERIEASKGKLSDERK